jgi:hypothetical protein
MEMGADRILFSVDYPFVPNAPGPKWMQTVPLGPEDRAKILHGNATKAKPFFLPAGERNPKQILNQAGGTVGGPIIHDKLFFFSSTEWTRVRSSGQVISLVPTPELLARTNINTRNYFNAFQLVAPINGLVHSVSEVLANFNLPATGAFGSLPGNLPAFGEVRATRSADFGAGLPVNDWQTINRLDYNWSDKTQIYIRGVYEQGKNPDGTISFSPYQGFNTVLAVEPNAIVRIDPPPIVRSVSSTLDEDANSAPDDGAHGRWVPPRPALRRGPPAHRGETTLGQHSLGHAPG